MVTEAKQNTTSTSTMPSFEMPSMEVQTQQLRELNERLITSSKSAALAALDTFEKALHGVGDLEKKAASATHNEWMGLAAATHATFMVDVSAPYTKAVRDLLK